MNSKQFFYNFGKAMYHVDSFYDDFAKQSSISTTLLWVLYVLNDGNAHTQIEICKDWELPRTTVNTVVKEIEKNGYIDLIPIKGKKREMNIVLTNLGKAYAEDVLSELYEIEAKVYDMLDANEKQVASMLNKIAESLKESKEEKKTEKNSTNSRKRILPRMG